MLAGSMHADLCLHCRSCTRVQHHGLEALLERNGTCEQLLDTTTGAHSRQALSDFTSPVVCQLSTRCWETSALHPVLHA